jgi:hypothetical protein
MKSGCQKFGRSLFGIEDAMLIIAFLLNYRDIILGFWAPLGATSSSMVLTIEVRISCIVISESRGSSPPSSSPRCKSSSCVWSVVLVRLRIFHIVDISQILGLRSPCHFSIALSCFISLRNAFVMIVIGQDVLLKFMKNFINYLGFL